MKPMKYLALVLVLSISCSALAQGPVHFADANLKAAVEAELGITDPTPTDMFALTNLRAYAEGITDSTGLEFATNLTTLNLGDNQLSDISVLSGLTQLTELSLGDNQLSDISALSGLTQLTVLRLSFNQINDISALSGLIQLTDLWLSFNQISNISALSGLTNLRVLSLNGNHMSDISALSGLTQLRMLYLVRTELSDISTLSRLSNLTWLFLFDNQVRDISALSGLTHLTSLSLLSNPLNQEACDTYIPQIISNNPGLEITYDPCITQYSLIISSSSGGSVTTPGHGVFSYEVETVVPVTAAAQSNRHFVNWTGTAVAAGKVANPNMASTTITVDASYTLSANFTPDQSAQYTLSITSNAGGSVTNPGEGRFAYDPGTSVTVTATAQDNYHFFDWTDSAVSAGKVSSRDTATTTVIMDGNYSLRAIFAEDHAACPSVSTYEPTNVTETSARLTGYLVNDGTEACTGWFRYWEKNRSAQTTLSTAQQSALQESQQYAQQVNDLLPGTTYCFQAIIENSTCLAEGSVREFTTLIIPIRMIHVDDDASNDPGPYDMSISDPQEDGTADHPYDSIQEGIEQAQDLDKVLVYEGRYYETINPTGKCIEIKRFVPEAAQITAYPVIDAQNRGTVVTCSSGEDPRCVLSGFVLTGGLHANGGAIACIGASPTIKNCLIVGNRSTDPAGTIIYCEDSHSLFENLTVCGNASAASGSAFRFTDCNTVITNSILWGDVLSEITVASGNDPTVVYTCIPGIWPGLGNIDADPRFALPGYWAGLGDLNTAPDPNEPNAVWVRGDYHLLSEAGRWDPISLAWKTDGLTSPCIDAGDPDSPWADEPRPHGAWINMGAYGGTDQASLSLRLIPIVAHWTFDDVSGGRASDSVGDSHGTVHGAIWTDGILEGALEFDGADDYVDCGNDPVLAPDQFTISLWIFAQATSGSRTILRKAGGDTDKDYDFELFGARNPTFSFGNGPQSLVLYSSSKLPLNEWTHITLTRGETEAAIHINGTHLISKTFDFAPSATDHSLIIGGGSTQPYKGKIDDVRIYDAVLSAEEIAGLATEGNF